LNFINLHWLIQYNGNLTIIIYDLISWCVSRLVQLATNSQQLDHCPMMAYSFFLELSDLSGLNIDFCSFLWIANHHCFVCRWVMLRSWKFFGAEFAFCFINELFYSYKCWFCYWNSGFIEFWWCCSLCLSCLPTIEVR